jgi:membrane fusion protein (multidrug efflux system)
MRHPQAGKVAKNGFSGDAEDTELTVPDVRLAARSAAARRAAQAAARPTASASAPIVAEPVTSGRSIVVEPVTSHRAATPAQAIGSSKPAGAARRSSAAPPVAAGGKALLSSPPLPPALPPAPAGPPAVVPQALLTEVFGLARRMAMQSDLRTAEQLLKRTVTEFLAADRVLVRYWHPGQVRLWELGESARNPPRHAGMCVEVARKKIGLWADRVRDLEAYLREVDDPQGSGDERVLVQPIFAGDQVVAVVLVVRDGKRAPFRVDERSVVDAIGGVCAPILQYFVFRHFSETQERALASPLFREQALTHQLKERQREGPPMRLSPAWVRWTYRVLVVITVASLAYGLLVRVGQYSSGMAVVRIDGERITTRADGTVAHVYVSQGDQVHAGDLLVDFHAGQEAANMKEVETEYERQLAAFLLDPSNNEAKSRLSSVSSQLERTKGILNERTIRAPRDGVVTDLRARVGMYMPPGEHVLSLETEHGPPQVVAFLPGSDLPVLKVGMEIRLELAGYDTPQLFARIDEIGREVIGPHEAARYLGTAKADTLQIPGPVVVVVARLATASFEHKGQPFRYHDGMLGRAEVRLRSESLLFSLLPSSK